MRQRAKQAALTCILALPLVITMAFTPAFTAQTAAQPGQRMVGPQFPILIDTNGDGRPTPGGDAPAAPQPLNSTQVQVTSMFSCSSDENERINLTNRDSSGRFTGVSRTNDFREQSINVAGFAGGGPSAFSYMERDGTGVREQGGGALADSNGDGRMDSMAVAGRVNTMLTLVFTPDSSYVSIPVSQAAALGARGRSCGPSSVPQVWVPLADTNADGIGDAIVLDLNGDGIADPEFYRSPALGATQVPSTNSVGLLILTVLLGGIGVWYIGRRRLGETGLA